MIEVKEKKKYIFTTDRNKIEAMKSGAFDGIKDYCGKIVTVKEIRAVEYGLQWFTIEEDDGRYIWTNEVAESEFDTRKRKLQKDDRDYTDFKKGDLVRFRTMAKLKEYFKSNDIMIMTLPVLLTDFEAYKELEGKEAIIKKITKEGKVELNILNVKTKKKQDFSAEMLEIIEEGYIDKMKAKIPKIEGNDEIIQEMISKVDVDKMKKILASSIRMKASDLKGVDKLLLQWAEAKKELYIILGRNLVARKEAKYNKDENTLKAEIYELADKFPGMSWILRNIRTQDFLDNSLSSSFGIDAIDRYMQRGKKVTKFISEVTQNPMVESYKKLTEEERETYLRLKEKVTFTPSLDIELSKMLENRYVEGSIAISIDPIDYLLMSTNRSGWNSCYKIADQSGNSRSWGQYVAGLFDYMCDGSTVVAYRHSNKLYEYNIGGSKFEAYSKNWRQVIYIDTENFGFLCSRPYPNQDKDTSATVRKFLESIICTNVGIPSGWKTDTIEYGKNMGEMKKKIKMKNKTLAYNDILNENQVQGEKLAYNKVLNNKDDLKFELGTNPICPVCGENTLTNHSKPMCESCWNSGR